jgi:hypothetical protein
MSMKKPSAQNFYKENIMAVSGIAVAAEGIGSEVVADVVIADVVVDVGAVAETVGTAAEVGSLAETGATLSEVGADFVGAGAGDIAGSGLADAALSDVGASFAGDAALGGGLDSGYAAIGENLGGISGATDAAGSAAADVAGGGLDAGYSPMGENLGGISGANGTTASGATSAADAGANQFGQAANSATPGTSPTSVNAPSDMAAPAQVDAPTAPTSPADSSLQLDTNQLPNEASKLLGQNSATPTGPSFFDSFTDFLKANKNSVMQLGGGALSGIQKQRQADQRNQIEQGYLGIQQQQMANASAVPAFQSTRVPGVSLYQNGNQYPGIINGAMKK